MVRNSAIQRAVGPDSNAIDGNSQWRLNGPIDEYPATDALAVELLLWVLGAKAVRKDLRKDDIR